MTVSASLHVPLPPPRPTENYGTVLRRGGWWLIDCEPHVMIMLKRVFVKVDPAGKDGVRVRRTPEVDRHLQWFLDRYPMEMAPADAAALHRGAEEAREIARVVSSCIAGTLEPRSFQLNGELREYQKLAAELWLRGKRMLLADDLGLGKQQPVDTPTLTPTGYQPLGSIRVGDRVIGSAGTPVTVTGVHPQGIKPSYALHFNDGISVESGPEHLWTVLYFKGGRTLTPLTVTLDQIRTGATLTRKWPNGGTRRINLGRTKLFVPMLTGAVKFDPGPALPIPPYCLGQLIANGSLAGCNATLTSHTGDWPEVRSSLLAEGVEIGGVNVYGNATRANLPGLMPSVRALGLDVLSSAKRIPLVYLRASAADRHALLQGLMDADGSCARGSKLSYATTSPGLATDLVDLVRHLGGIAEVIASDRTAEGKGIEYAVRVRVLPQFPAFRLARKLAHATPKQRTLPTRRITGVSFVRNVESVCISVDAPDALYCTEHAVLTHNTVEAIAGLSEPALRPACVVTGVHLMRQWKAMLEKWLPGIRVHIIDGTTVYDVPTVHAKREAKAGKLMGTGFPDVVILAYTRMQGWADYLRGKIKSVVYDEVQELRHTTTEKYKASQVLTSEVAYVLGMSATPIHNYGGEFFAVLEAIKPGALGTKEEFNREWCAGSGEGGKVKVANPRAFGLYLRESGLMLRRSREEVGRELPSLTTIPYTIPSDPAALERIRSSATELARTILRQGAVSTRGFDKMQAAGQLDMLLRQATGIAKAPAAAQHLRMIVEQGERVLAFAWHREVYGILQAQLKEYAPAMFTGTETERQKAESLRRFIEGETPILLMSLRAGAAGVDGLQHCCRTVVHIELDWSPHVHGQGTGRVHRDGQPDPVFEYFLLAEDGSDPIVSDVLGVKRAQFAPIRDPDQKLMAGHFDPDHIKRLAEGYLAARGLRV